MTEIADDRSWWADVEHLRPDGEGPRSVPATSPRTRGAAEPPERPGHDERKGRDARPQRAEHAARSGRSAREEAADTPAVRRGRITGVPVERSDRARRPDVAAFADALDLDGAFGGPVPVARRSREIILTGTPSGAPRLLGSVEPPEAFEAPHELDAADTRPDRKTVRITGNPALDAGVAERRALREITERRPRSAVERVVSRPDRIAMYVVLLGLFLVFIAATGSSAGS